MDPAELRPAPVAAAGAARSAASLGYVARTPALAIPLAMMAVVGTLGYNFQVILPLLGALQLRRRGGDLHGAGGRDGRRSVAGALVAGARGRVGPRLLIAAAFGFGVVALLAAVAPSVPLEIAALIPLGAASVTFAAGINSSLQLAADPAMRGRVMALYSIVFLGSTPIGGPIAGFLSQSIDPRAALVMAGAAGLAAAVGRARRVQRMAGGGGGGCPVGTRSRPSPGVLISLTGEKAELGST